MVGLGQNENFLASDALALAGTTDQIIYLEDGDVVDLQLARGVDRRPGRQAGRAQGARCRCIPARPSWARTATSCRRRSSSSRAVGDTLQDIESITPELFGDGAYKVFKEIDSLLILACGTSYYAGLTAKYWIESIARIPVAVEIASEYRYRDSVPNLMRWWSPFRSRARPPNAGRAQACALAGHAAHADGVQRGHQRHGAQCELASSPARASRSAWRRPRPSPRS